MQTTKASALDVPGLIRRVRRAADLSQRELAERLGVDQATVSRWESGQAVPDVLSFAGALGLAGIDLVALDSESSQAEPMSAAPPLDRQGRRYPAHLDLMQEKDPLHGRPRLTTPHRRRRDWHRAWSGLGVPRDHPTLADFDAEGRRRRDERVARSLELARARAGARARVRGQDEGPVALCCCPIGCEEQPGCPPDCPCGCERMR